MRPKNVATPLPADKSQPPPFAFSFGSRRGECYSAYVVASLYITGGVLIVVATGHRSTLDHHPGRRREPIQHPDSASRPPYKISPEVVAPKESAPPSARWWSSAPSPRGCSRCGSAGRWCFSPRRGGRGHKHERARRLLVPKRGRSWETHRRSRHSMICALRASRWEIARSLRTPPGKPPNSAGCSSL